MHRLFFCGCPPCCGLHFHKCSQARLHNSHPETSETSHVSLAISKPLHAKKCQTHPNTIRHGYTSTSIQKVLNSAVTNHIRQNKVLQAQIQTLTTWYTFRLQVEKLESLEEQNYVKLFLLVCPLCKDKYGLGLYGLGLWRNHHREPDCHPAAMHQSLFAGHSSACFCLRVGHRKLLQKSAGPDHRHKLVCKWSSHGVDSIMKIHRIAARNRYISMQVYSFRACSVLQTAAQLPPAGQVEPNS